MLWMWKFNISLCVRLLWKRHEEEEGRTRSLWEWKLFSYHGISSFHPLLKTNKPLLSQQTCIFAHISAKHITNHKLYDITHIPLIKPMRKMCIYVMQFTSSSSSSSQGLSHFLDGFGVEKLISREFNAARADTWCTF